MTWKSWIPGYGKHSVRKKLRELDQAGVGIPMIIILLLTKGIELLIKGVGNELPIPLWLTFFVSGAGVFILYVYDKQLREKIEE